MKRLLVLRLSAMGDVAMAVPVIKELLRQHPNVEVVFVSQPFLKPLFDGIERCTFFGFDKKLTHKGFAGIYRFYKGLTNIKFDAVADLHNVLRSKILSSFFLISGVRIATIDKGRNEKNALTRKSNKVMKQLRTSHERYADVLGRLGYPVILPTEVIGFKKAGSSVKKIGIAPFAQHAPKMYPLDKMKEVVKILAQQTNFEIFLLGAKGNEEELLEEWSSLWPNVNNIAGKYPFVNELKIISDLDLMVSMDSANMHIASLYKVPVVSVWGATHRFAGFLGWQQNPEFIVEKELYCRPCSVFGNKPCYRGDHACMEEISPIHVAEKIINLLSP